MLRKLSLKKCFSHKKKKKPKKTQKRALHFHSSTSTDSMVEKIFFGNNKTMYKSQTTWHEKIIKHKK